MHDVPVEDVVDAGRTGRPRCLDGARACPPEDVGGFPGYEQLLAALPDPGHEMHEELTEWIGSFDPEAFDAVGVTAALRVVRG
ncbi:MAG: hypothetical protein QOI76_110 [Frankiales bacterium]|nr:hypothetical protein [Frankiales bacterium]